MGYKESPRLFTKLMKVPLAFLREHYNCILVCYIDDILILGHSIDSVLKSTAYVANLLQMLGFYINAEKSELSPKTCIEFLGFSLNSIEMSVSLTMQKREKIRNLAIEILNKPQFTIRCLAQFLGNCVASFPAVEYGPFHTKELELEKIAALNANHWDFEANMSLSDWALTQVSWWRDNIFQVAKTSLVVPPTNYKYICFLMPQRWAGGHTFLSLTLKQGVYGPLQSSRSTSMF